MAETIEIGDLTCRIRETGFRVEIECENPEKGAEADISVLKDGTVDAEVVKQLTQGRVEEQRAKLGHVASKMRTGRFDEDGEQTRRASAEFGHNSVNIGIGEGGLGRDRSCFVYMPEYGAPESGERLFGCSRGTIGSRDHLHIWVDEDGDIVRQLGPDLNRDELPA